jgi:hypothetical protein
MMGITKKHGVTLTDRANVYPALCWLIAEKIPNARISDTFWFTTEVDAMMFFLRFGGIGADVQPDL